MQDRDEAISARLRGLPQIQRLLEMSQPDPAGASRLELTQALRSVLDHVRAELKTGEAVDCAPQALLERAKAHLGRARLPGLRRVINATGVVVHTNLGRAPLAAEALEAVLDVAGGYSNLEFDLDAGQRGSRTQSLEPLLCELTGAEAGLAVNNAAAAVLLALSALADDGEVIVSRGELVEIGGGFRVPDVITQGGARLVEVGTTNKTRLADYRNAVTPATRVLLKVHQSNYRIIGFTSETRVEELTPLAAEHGLLVMHDLGSGALVNPERLERRREPTVRDAVAAGADIVAFSGDKLMGGPQAGLLVGKRDVIDRLRRHPLLRAVRLDKMALAALEATLRLYRDPQRAAQRIPVLRMLAQTEGELRARAHALRDLLAGCDATLGVEASEAYAGGGSLPEDKLASCAVTVLGPDVGPDEIARRLRGGRPAVVGRIAGGRLVLDMLTVADSELSELAMAVRNALSLGAG